MGRGRAVGETPRIYELVAEERIRDILTSFNACFELPIQLLGEDGTSLLQCGQPSAYCRLLKQHVFSPRACERQHMDAGRRALELGEAYIFACHANLNHIAFPLSSQGRLLGVILAGPFLMDEPDSSLLSGLGARCEPGVLLDLYDELHGVKLIRPAMAGAMSRLLYYLLSPLLPEQGSVLRHNHESVYQQARISESIQRFKEQSPGENYPYELEQALMTKVKTKDLPQAKGVLNELLGYVFFCEGGRMETMKNRSLELCALLSRVSIEGGALTDLTFRLSNQFLSALQHIDTLEELCIQLQEIVEAFVDAMFSAPDGPGADSIRRAVGYIARHYTEPIELQDVARAVGLSPSYFSALFKQLTGSTFRAYLNQVRVEESKRLLRSTGYSLVDIAMAAGFADQSYFSKVFKKYTGLTPKAYR